MCVCVCPFSIVSCQILFNTFILPMKFFKMCYHLKHDMKACGPKSCTNVTLHLYFRIYFSKWNETKIYPGICIQVRGLAAYASSVSFGCPEHCFFDSLDTQKFKLGFGDDFS